MMLQGQPREGVIMARYCANGKQIEAITDGAHGLNYVISDNAVCEPMPENTTQRIGVFCHNGGTWDVKFDGQGGFVWPEGYRDWNCVGGPAKALQAGAHYRGDVIGPRTVGSTLVANEIEWEFEDIVYTKYEWRVDGQIVSADPAYATKYFTITPEMAGKTISLIRHTSTAVGTLDLPEVTIGTVGAVEATPVIADPPKIKGYHAVGERLHGISGRWDTDTGVTDRQCSWKVNGAVVPSATTNTFVVRDQDAGKVVTFHEEVTSAGGTASAESEPTSAMSPRVAPRNITPPVILGYPNVAEQLTIDLGTWESDNGMSTGKVEWMVAGEVVKTDPLTGQATYAAVAGDMDKVISARVTVENPTGSANAVTANTNPVKKTGYTRRGVPTKKPWVPVNLAVGQSVQCTPGEWKLYPGTSVGHQFNANGTNIAGFQDYLFTADDYHAGKNIRVMETVYSDEGAAGNSSDDMYVFPKTGTVVGFHCNGRIPVEHIADGNGGYTEQEAAIDTRCAEEGLPYCSVPFTVTGVFALGQKLTITAGTWNYPTYRISRRWSADNNPIEGQTGTTLTLTEAMIGKTIRAYEYITNSKGMTLVEGDLMGPLWDGPAPHNTVLPVVDGTPEVGQFLTGYTGAWQNNDPDGFTFKWFLDEEEIYGKTKRVIPVRAGYVGKSLTLEVTARGRGGIASKMSNATAIVAMPGFGCTVDPEITGNPALKQMVTCDGGSWTEEPASLAYQWYLDDEIIPGETSQSMNIANSMMGGYLSVWVTATDSEGNTALGVSRAVGPIDDLSGVLKPICTEKPSVTGNPKVDSVLTGTPGSWQSDDMPTGFTYQWLADGVALAPAAGVEDPMTLTLLEEHIGKSIKLSVSMSNSLGTTTEVSEASAPVTPNWPAEGTILEQTCAGFEETQTIADGVGGTTTNVIPKSAHCGYIATPSVITQPVVTGIQRNGETLTAKVAVWEAVVGVTYRAFWKRDGVEIPEEGDTTYVLTLEDVGKTITFHEEATASDGVVTASSNGIGPVWHKAGHVISSSCEGTTLVEVIADGNGGTTNNSVPNAPECTPMPPISVSPPYVLGDLVVGQTLTITPGVWENEPTVTRQWAADDIEIAGATGDTFLLTTAQIGKTITVIETATNVDGSDIAQSEARGPVLPEAPVNTAMPVITGEAKVGSVLTCSDGEWDRPGGVFTYQWYNDSGPISGATNNTYTPVSGDVGMYVFCDVTYSFGGISSHMEADSAGPIVGGAPVNNTPCSIEGVPRAGRTLTVRPGNWAGTPELTYEWLGDGNPLPGINTTEFVLTMDNIGAVITCRETATADGQTTSVISSNSLGPVTDAEPPEVITAPSITGTPALGQTLTANVGEWSRNPTSINYRWHHPQSNTFLGTDSQDLVIAAPVVVGDTIELWVTAENEDGETTDDTAKVTVADPPITNVTPATITGTPKVGQTLTAEEGTWSETPDSFTYQWRNAGEAMPGVTAKTYKIPPGTVGVMFSVTVTAAKGASSASSTSNPVGPVEAADPTAPVNNSPPVVRGEAVVGQTLTGEVGSWEITEMPPKLIMEWKAGTEVLKVQELTQPIELLLTEAMIGKQIVFEVTMGNEIGDTTVASAPTDAVEAYVPGPPVCETPAAIAGGMYTGITLSVTPGSWKDATAEQITSYWQVDGQPLEDHTSHDLLILPEWVGMTIEYIEHAVTEYGSVAQAATGATGVVIARDPMNLQLPQINGLLIVGAVINGTPGVWDQPGGTPAYAWFADLSQVSDFSDSSEFQITPECEGKKMTVQVRYGTSAGEGFATSAESTPVGLSAPVNTTPPSISGEPEVGATLSVERGVWQAADTIAYQWLSGENVLQGGEETTFVVLAEHAGMTIKVKEFATNAQGTTEVEASNTIGPIVAEQPPVNTLAPSISGDPRLGGTLTAAPGNWDHNPTSFVYNWYTVGENVKVGEGQTFLLDNRVKHGDILTIKVDATNEDGTTRATGSNNLTVYDPIPVATTAPEITGTPKIGATLTCSTGEWSRAGGTFTYNWIVGGVMAQSSALNTYTPKEGDYNKKVVCRVIYTVGEDTGSAETAEVGPVTLSAPIINVAPKVTGEMRVGKTVTTDDGQWTGVEPFEYAYAWYIGGDVVPGHFVNTLTLTEDMIGKMVQSQVSLTDANGTLSADSIEYGPVVPAHPAEGTIVGTECQGFNKFNQVADGNGGVNLVLAEENSVDCGFVAPPVNATVPTIEGDAFVNKVLKATPGTWTGAGPITTEVRWTANGVDIPNATGLSFAVTAAMVGKRIGVISKASNMGGTTEASSAETEEVEPAGPTNPPAGTVLYQMCEGKDLVKIVANGDGTSTRTVQANHADCVNPAPAPVNTVAPTVSGTGVTGQALSTTNGTWANAKVFTYQWYADNAPIIGADRINYTPVSGDVGKAVKCRVTVYGDGGYGSADSMNSITITQAVLAPVNTIPPAITGTPLSGATLTAERGTWTGSGISYAYKWFADDVEIVGETKQTLFLKEEFVRKVIKLTVTASNSHGSASADAPPTDEISTGGVLPPGMIVAEYCEGTTKVVTTINNVGVGETVRTDDHADCQGNQTIPPRNSKKPWISGEGVVGNTLEGKIGVWPGAGYTYEHQWYVDRVAVPGATGMTFDLTWEHVGKQIAWSETVSNDAGFMTMFSSNAIISVAGVAPTNTVKASISGVAKVGQPLTAANGTWEHADSFTRQWAVGGVDVVGATAATFTPLASHVGKTTTVKVKGINQWGNLVIESDPTLQIVSAATPTTPPVNTGLPTISGKPILGGMLAAYHGTWTGAETYTHKWQADNVDIAGATNNTYTLTEDEVGKSITVIVTATNTYGNASATSAGTEAVIEKDPLVPGTIISKYCDETTLVTVKVTSEGTIDTVRDDDHADCVGNAVVPPQSINKPAPGGTGVVGTTMTVVPGTWTTTDHTLSYKWIVDGVEVPGATGTTFALTWEHVGKSVNVIEVATNAAGFAGAFGAPMVNSVKGKPPTNTEPPVITGNAVVGQTLTMEFGTWEHNLGRDYEWYVDGEFVEGNYTPNFPILPEHKGKMIGGSAIGINEWGIEPVEAEAVGPVTDGTVPVAPPVNTKLPAIIGEAKVGKILASAVGEWTGNTPITTTMQWYASGVVIPGATGSTLTLTAAYEGKRIVLVESASNSGGTTNATSLPTAVVTDDDQFPVAGTILSSSCEGTTKVDIVANGRGGSYPVKHTKSEECGYVPFPDNEVDELIEEHKNSSNKTLKMLATVLGCYRDRMGFTKPCSAQTIHELQLQLWAALRAAVFEEDAFRDCMDFILAVFRENRDGAFELEMVLRTVDMVDTRLTGDQRDAYIGLMNVYTWAGRLHDKSEVKDKVDLQKAISPTIFSDEARTRLIGYFNE